MNYKLAKKLKDAGFKFHHEDSKWSEYIFPTLSELIEACGEKLWNIQKDNNMWHANFRQGSEYDYGEAEGKTREEAVANLWLKLNV